MARVPLVGRLFWREYVALLGSLLLIFLEVPVRIITLLLPPPLLHFFYNRSKNLFNRLSSQRSVSHPIATASDFTEICTLFGYHAEEHVVQTADGYLLGIHRLPYRKREEQNGVLVNAGPRSVIKPVIYLHHGLLMNSEVWVCITEEERCLPFALVERGYDVWLGNNRGNKYSKKSTRFSPASADFWNFSMDQFAFHDIPDSIDYILGTTSQPSLSYIGFSQGTAQAFAALSIHPPLNEKINLFIALAPAMSPAGLSNGMVDSLVKASPNVLYLALGRKSLLSSATFWQSVLYPPIFVRLIDISLSFLFNWSCQNLSAHQKLAAYPHLYSFTSTKSVVHWFQIIRNKSFQMYDDDSSRALSIGASDRYYKVAKFPTRNIRTPIVLVYGGVDSLVDIEAMLRELPHHTIAFEIKHFEHLDFLWAQDVDKAVFPHVFDAVNYYSYSNAQRTHSSARQPNLLSAHAGLATLRAENGSVLGDGRSTPDPQTPLGRSKNTAQIVRQSQYISAAGNSSPTMADSPLLSWEISRPATRRLAGSRGSNYNGNNSNADDVPGADGMDVAASLALAPQTKSHGYSQPIVTRPPGVDLENKRLPGESGSTRRKTRSLAGSGSSQDTASNVGSTTPSSGFSATRFGIQGIRLGTSRPSVSVARLDGIDVEENRHEDIRGRVS